MQLKLKEISAEIKSFTIDSLQDESLLCELQDNCLVYAEFYHQVCLGKYMAGNIYLGNPDTCKAEKLGEDLPYLREICFFWQKGELRCKKNQNQYICRKIEDKEQKDSYYILEETHKLWGTAVDKPTEPGWTLLKDGRGSRILLPVSIEPGEAAGLEVCHYIEYGNASQAGGDGFTGLQNFKARRQCGFTRFVEKESLRKTFSEVIQEGRG